MRDSWELIKSTVRREEVSQIKHRFFIPPEYKVIIPRPQDRMHKPPPNCFTFHLASLEVGLRFPLSPTIEDILVRLGVCLAQFAPNAVRHIIGFIVLAKHFKVEPSVAHFWALYSITTLAKTNDRGMVVRSSQVAKVIRERKERLIVATQSYGLNIPPSPSVHSSGPSVAAPEATQTAQVERSEPPTEGQPLARPGEITIAGPPPFLAIEAGALSDPKDTGAPSDPKDKGKSKHKKSKSRSRSGSKSKNKGSGGSKQKKKKARVEKEQPTEEEISLALSQIADR
ncbi:hypothetical protein DH2020_033654 [Rehmannia glutinosa]|uniref:Transposase (putative) gypsy type domain-containing protein n=1 Tax=Rehmannia glutinosa TaxID=99300 RepID=A0ABR0VEU6_REHGL